MSHDESLTSKEQAAKYFRLNVTIPMLDDVITCLTDRFAQGQEDVMGGVMLIPSSVSQFQTGRSYCNLSWLSM